MLFLLQDYLINTAKSSRHKIAIKAKNRSLSYADLDRDSNKIASYLQNIGITRGDRVVIALGNLIETAIVFWAVLKANAVVSIINSEQPIDKIEYIMSDCGAKVLYTNNNEISRNSKNKTYKIFSSNDINAMLKESAATPSRKAIDLDLASIIYTSGSTGEPKGVMMTHRNMIAATEAINSYLKNQNEDIIFCALPLSFDYGLYQMIMATSKGATLILENNFLIPALALRTIAAEKVTALPLVPSMITLMKDHYYFKAYNLSSVRYVTNTGAALTKKHISYIKYLFPNAQIFSMYGVTECKRCTYLPPEEIEIKPTSVGKAIPNTEIFIVDENNKILSPNHIGQLVVRGATLMQGYWNKQELSMEKLKPNPSMPNEMLLYTGDYGYLDSAGYFYFQGRNDEIIKCRGVKVSPKEVEEVALQVDGLEEAALLDFKSDNEEPELHLFVAIKNPSPSSINNILDYCRKNLEKEKIPTQIHISRYLPKNENGKINKLLIREQYFPKLTPGA
jgi:amino acid adenylation domain-containing protein